MCPLMVYDFLSGSSYSYPKLQNLWIPCSDDPRFASSDLAALFLRSITSREDCFHCVIIDPRSKWRSVIYGCCGLCSKVQTGVFTHTYMRPFMVWDRVRVGRERRVGQGSKIRGWGATSSVITFWHRILRSLKTLYSKLPDNFSYVFVKSWGKSIFI